MQDIAEIVSRSFIIFVYSVLISLTTTSFFKKINGIF